MTPVELGAQHTDGRKTAEPSLQESDLGRTIMNVGSPSLDSTSSGS